MKIRVVALGQRMPAWVDAGWDEYARRMPQEFTVELVALKAEPRDRGKTVAQILAAEAKRIADACKNAHVVALDERGEQWTTRALADRSRAGATMRAMSHSSSAAPTGLRNRSSATLPPPLRFPR